MLTPNVSAFSNWTKGDAPFVGGLQALVGVAMIAGFSFQGTEMVGVAAGESKDPKKTIPLAIKQIFGEFYFSIFCVFSSLVHWSATIILCYCMPQKVKILHFLHLLFSMKKQDSHLLQA